MNGASVTKRELFSILFEDSEYTRSKQDHMKKIMHALKATLAQIGIPELLVHNRNAYAVNMALIATDLPGEQIQSQKNCMLQYSWVE